MSTDLQFTGEHGRCTLGSSPDTSSTSLTATAPRPLDLAALLNRAIDAKSIEGIERLVALVDRQKAEWAKAQFDESLSAFQAECPPIRKTVNVENAYKYAPIEFIETAIRPMLRKFGFSHTFDTDVTSVDGWVIARCLVTHSAGHSRSSTVKLPLGGKTRLMSNTQQYAAALTFANRRALQNAYGLVLAGEDLDGAGEAETQSPVRPKPGKAPAESGGAARKRLLTEIWNALASVRGDDRTWDKINNWLWEHDILDGGIPEAMPKLSEDKLREVLGNIQNLLS